MSRIYYMLLISAFLAVPVWSWNPLHRQQGKKAAFRPFETKSTSSVAIVTKKTENAKKKKDSRLFYTNGYEDDEAEAVIAYLLTPNTDAAGVTAIPAEKPRAMDLPRHSPPKELVQRHTMLLDMEMIVGRIAMVTALLLFGGEILTGLTMTDQVSGLWQ
mmetsp:Transcript_2025/g.3252  ORF Transcript_2025/g.3252 Transcript_2025/m.3252 type:complete len:159 (+) Transcript_2025:124-600(+)